MTPQLQSALAAIHSELDQIIAEGEKATAGPWDNEKHNWIYAKVPKGRTNGEGIGTMRGEPHHGMTRAMDIANATFIAHSRNLTPKMAREMKGLMDALEAIACDHPEDNEMRALQTLVSNWNKP